MEDNFLVMRDFGQTKPPSVEKVKRDTYNMYHYSKYVIVLDEKGEIKEKINRVSGYLGYYLVIIAPVVYQGEKINTVVLEIGFARSVPYQQFEKKFEDENKLRIKGRRTIAILSAAALILLLPIISSSIQKIIDEDTSHRKSLVWETRSSKKEGIKLVNGKFITIPTDAEILVFVFLEIDLRLRKNGHLSLFVKLTKEKLSTLPYAYYPNRQLKRLKVAKDIAFILGEANYPEHFVNVIRRKLGKETTKYRALFEQIIEVFKISFHSGNENDLLYKALSAKFSDKSEGLMKSSNLSVMIHPKRDKVRKIHARNCIRVEVFPSTEAVLEKHPELGYQFKT